MLRFYIAILLILNFGFSNAQTARPNILWISAEDIGLGWGCYGDTYASTPHIDQLAKDGYVFTQAYSNAPICAPARSTLITGMYATSLGTQHLRSEIPVPADFRILSELMREGGYFTTNNSKTDYNFSAQGRWDENGNDAHWRNAPDDRPFFSVFNFGITHEGHANTEVAEDTKSLTVKHDPAQANLPPYFPQTEAFKSIWAHQYDLISVFDQEVGKLIKQLDEDSKLENTIIFVFSDHGYGLPRYKRWLYNSGLQVPFVLHVPEKYQDWTRDLQMSAKAANKVKQMVGFVDFAPTVLQLAGLEVPDRMEGKSFLGEKSQPNQLVYGYRSRADDCYDMARSVYDGRYLYIRHFMPHKAYIQNAIIFDTSKRSYQELHRLKDKGELPQEAADMFAPKAVEELYDLQTDPYELKNLIGEEVHHKRARQLKEKLYNWMLAHHDTGLLNEGEMMMRAKAQNSSVYEMARNSKVFDVNKILSVADRVGYVQEAEELKSYLLSADSGVKYWALIALGAYNGDLQAMKTTLQKLLTDTSYVVRIQAAELLAGRLGELAALQTLAEMLLLDEEAVVLQAAISVRELGETASPLVDTIVQEVMPKYSGEVWGRYKNWFYPMFIGMALDQTLRNCGHTVEIRN
ncbi:sulfatase-like hydrolase/transferase [Porifericola rhodea]|uniref:sulfatase-like hydrolase/transferase n=1 Tax=Porifericola rhodea TaxID=930972 RepID=UPI0026670CCB|nr:sulfatase-like hydrolase/transferase [Porifericola rhodea]WKN30075.1 sulfatase-like hydrolase/transferase [Porifericola rhodea]